MLAAVNDPSVGIDDHDGAADALPEPVADRCVGHLIVTGPEDQEIGRIGAGQVPRPAMQQALSANLRP